MLTQEVLNSIDKSVLCWLATANENGEPNVSPKEMFIANDLKHILIANTASPKSIQNIYINPSVCLSFVDVFIQKGFKVKGVATIIEQSSEEFLTKEAVLRKLGGDQFKIKSIIEVMVSSVNPIMAPSYLLSPETTESSQIQQAMVTYGVIPKNHIDKRSTRTR